MNSLADLLWAFRYVYLSRFFHNKMQTSSLESSNLCECCNVKMFPNVSNVALWHRDNTNLRWSEAQGGSEGRTNSGQITVYYGHCYARAARADHYPPVKHSDNAPSAMSHPGIDIIIRPVSIPNFSLLLYKALISGSVVKECWLQITRWWNKFVSYWAFN